MADNKTKTKADMLIELESIKGLLKEEDDIPILQEVIENSRSAPAQKKYSEQQDFFNSAAASTPTLESGSQLLDTLSDLERMTVEVASNKSYENKYDGLKSQNQQRPQLAKANGENPFLPQHIRSRLHGNNPPPLFEIEAARKIANISQPATQLGNTKGNQLLPGRNPIFSSPKSSAPQQALIDEIMDELLPEIERELRERLEVMTKEMLETLLKN